MGVSPERARRLKNIDSANERYIKIRARVTSAESLTPQQANSLGAEFLTLRADVLLVGADIGNALEGTPFAQLAGKAAEARVPIVHALIATERGDYSQARTCIHRIADEEEDSIQKRVQLLEEYALKRGKELDEKVYRAFDPEREGAEKLRALAESMSDSGELFRAPDPRPH